MAAGVGWRQAAAASGNGQWRFFFSSAILKKKKKTENPAISVLGVVHFKGLYDDFFLLEKHKTTILFDVLGES